MSLIYQFNPLEKRCAIQRGCGNIAQIYEEYVYAASQKGEAHFVALACMPLQSACWNGTCCQRYKRLFKLMHLRYILSVDRRRV